MTGWSAWRVRVVGCVAVALVAMAVPGLVGAQQEGFSDVTGGAHQASIDGLNELGLFEGTLCGEGLFCPNEPMKRSTMAVWLVRTLDGVDPASVSATRFSDVDGSHVFAAFIERFAEMGVTSGCATDPLRYCPDKPVTRAQMATFLVRAFALEPAGAAGFVDVDDGGTHDAGIDALAAAGVTSGCATDPLRYCPDKPVTRAQMATFLTRARAIIDTPDTTEPAPAGAATYKTVTAGWNHSCAILTDDTITCWGSNKYGQTNAPAGTYKTVTAGWSHSCAIATDDTITCWGSNTYGQTNAPAGTYKTVTAGWNHSCAIATDDTITCWGNNADGQTNAPAGTYKTVTAGWPPQLCDSHRRHHHLLGLQHIRANQRPGRHLQNRHRRQGPQLCDSHRRHHHLLGHQQIRENQRSGGDLQDGHRGRGP